MSIKLIAQAFTLQLTPLEKLLLVALADMAGDDNQCAPTFGVLKRRTGLETEELVNLTASLERQRLVRRLSDPWRWELTLHDDRGDL